MILVPVCVEYRELAIISECPCLNTGVQKHEHDKADAQMAQTIRTKMSNGFTSLTPQFAASAIGAVSF